MNDELFKLILARKEWQKKGIAVLDEILEHKAPIEIRNLAVNATELEKDCLEIAGKLEHLQLFLHLEEIIINKENRDKIADTIIAVANQLKNIEEKKGE